MTKSPVSDCERPDYERNDCQRLVVAIDGPVASGKTAVGRALAKRLGWRLFDTGIMYRAATWLAERHGTHFDDPESVADLIRNSDFELSPCRESDSAEFDVMVNGENATPFLRDSAVESGVPTVAAIAEVRALMVEIQQAQAARGCMIVVGRDIGTVVLPEAPAKIYLNASEEVRARRRAAEQLNGGDEQTVLIKTRRRDAKDRGRATSPLKAADDAIVLDTSDLTLEESIDRAEQIVRERIPELGATDGPSTFARG